jgi:hypothetical protein
MEFETLITVLMEDPFELTAPTLIANPPPPPPAIKGTPTASLQAFHTTAQVSNHMALTPATTDGAEGSRTCMVVVE